MQHVDLQCIRHIQRKKDSLYYKCFASTARAQAVAAASLLVALKLHNSPNPIQYVANVFASTCYERLSRPQRTRELIDGFKHLKEKAKGRTWFNAAWKVLPLS
jgi:hypothetical protein